MKKSLLFLTLLCHSFIFCVYAQNPVPNPGFENWTSGNPDNWYTYNMGPGASPILQSTIANTGLSSARGEVIMVGPVPFFPILSSTNSSAQGFPVTQAYSTLTFYYQVFVQGSTTFAAYVGMNDVNVNPVGAGVMIFNTNVSTWTQASIPIFYSGSNPVECVIGFVLEDTVTVPSVGNYYMVDDIELTGSVGIDDKPQVLTTSLEKLSPNPSADFTTVYFSVAEQGDVNFELYDVTGKKFHVMKLKDEIAGRHKIDLDLSGIPAGLYVVNMTTSESSDSKRLIVVN